MNTWRIHESYDLEAVVVPIMTVKTKTFVGFGGQVYPSEGNNKKIRVVQDQSEVQFNIQEQHLLVLCLSCYGEDDPFIQVKKAKEPINPLAL